MKKLMKFRVSGGSMVISLPAEIVRKAKFQMGDSAYVAWNELSGIVEIIPTVLDKVLGDDEELPQFDPENAVVNKEDIEKYFAENPDKTYKDYTLELGRRDKAYRAKAQLERTKKMFSQNLKKKGITFPDTYSEWLQEHPYGDLEDFHMARRLALGIESEDYYSNPVLFTPEDKLALDRFNDEEAERNKAFREKQKLQNSNN